MYKKIKALTLAAYSDLLTNSSLYVCLAALWPLLYNMILNKNGNAGQDCEEMILL